MELEFELGLSGSKDHILNLCVVMWSQSITILHALLFVCFFFVTRPIPTQVLQSLTKRSPLLAQTWQRLILETDCGTRELLLTCISSSGTRPHLCGAYSLTHKFQHKNQKRDCCALPPSFIPNPHRRVHCRQFVSCLCSVSPTARGQTALRV